MEDPFASGDVPKIGVGTWQNTDPDQCQQSVETALDIGYRHIDTAQGYENEEYVGKGIARSSVPRDELFVATKVWNDDLDREGVLRVTDASRDKLGLDVIDLLYVHWPAGKYRPTETLSAFRRVQDEGKIRHVGISNFTPRLWREALEVLEEPVFANQVEMHVLLQQRELLKLARDQGSYLVAYSPLRQGTLVDEPLLEEVASSYDATPAQVALAWLIDKANVLAIPKATGRAHLEENFGALEVDLAPEDVERIDNIGREDRSIDPHFAPW